MSSSDGDISNTSFNTDHAMRGVHEPVDSRESLSANNDHHGTGVMAPGQNTGRMSDEPAVRRADTAALNSEQQRQAAHALSVLAPQITWSASSSDRRPRPVFIAGQLRDPNLMRSAVSQFAGSQRARLEEAFANLPGLRRFQRDMVTGTPPAYSFAAPLDDFYRLPIRLEVRPDLPAFQYYDSAHDMYLRLVRILPRKQGDDSGSQELECELRNFTRELLPSYECLSYCWGQDTTTYPICLNGAVFEVRRTLATFLLQAQREEESSPWVWIDAMCVNQLSVEDKSHFVPMMDEIYWDAERIIIALGAGNEKLDQAVVGYSEFVKKHQLQNRADLNFEHGQYAQASSPHAWGLQPDCRSSILDTCMGSTGSVCTGSCVYLEIARPVRNMVRQATPPHQAIDGRHSNPQTAETAEQLPLGPTSRPKSIGASTGHKTCTASCSREEVATSGYA